MNRIKFTLAIFCVIVVLAVPFGLSFSRSANLHIPNDSAADYQLVEQWRVEYDNKDALVGIFSSAASDQSGHIYFLDPQLSQILAYSPKGEYLATLSREGDGPGETRNPQDILVFSDDILCILQGMPSKLTCLNPDDTPAASITPMPNDEGKFMGMLSSIHVGGDNLVVAGAVLDMKDLPKAVANYFIASLDRQGNELCRYLDKNYSFSYEDYVSNEVEEDVADNCYAVDSSGRVYIAPIWDEYLIEVYSREGSLLRTIEKDYKSFARPDTTMKQLQKLSDEGHGTYIFADTYRDIHELSILSDDTILVLSSRGFYSPPTGAACVYDRYSPDGTFLGEIKLVFSSDFYKGRFFFLSTGQIILLPNNDPSNYPTSGSDSSPPPAAICFSIAIPGG